MPYGSLKQKNQIELTILAQQLKEGEKSYSIFKGGSIKKTASEIGPSSEMVALRELPLKMDLQKWFSLVNRP
jgi:hypothetical protein